MRYGGKKDQNHRIIVDLLRASGCPTYDLSGVGGGVPDLIVWAHGQWRLVEIKNLTTSYGKRGLNKLQKQWIAQWNGGPIFVLTSIQDAELFAKGRLETIKTVQPNDAAIQLMQARAN